MKYSVSSELLKNIKGGFFCYRNELYLAIEDKLKKPSGVTCEDSVPVLSIKEGIIWWLSGGIVVREVRNIKGVIFKEE